MIDSTADFNRVARTLAREEPDRVPLAEVVVDYSIMSQFLGRTVTDDDLQRQVEFWSAAGYDFIPLPATMMEAGGVTERSAISRAIKNVLTEDAHGPTDEAWNLERGGWIDTEEDFENFPWKEAANLNYAKFHDVQKWLPEGMKIIAVSGKIFTLTWMLMGFENFCLSLSTNPGLVRRVIEKVASIQLAAVRRMASIPNVAAVWAVDDLAFASGPFINPRAMRGQILPWYEEFIRLCHESRLYVFFHSDGLLWNLVDDLIALGIDALHPLDPNCMDIEEAKKRIGDKVTLIGNISNELLMNGTPDEVIELTKKRLKALAPGGGYCLGSGNSVPAWANIENYRAMVSTGRQYGHYPICVD